jgi:hypothetical protein
VVFSLQTLRQKLFAATVRWGGGIGIKLEEGKVQSHMKRKGTEIETKLRLCKDICGFSLQTLRQQLGEGKRTLLKEERD